MVFKQEQRKNKKILQGIIEMNVSGFRYPRSQLEGHGVYYGGSISDKIQSFLDWMDAHENQTECDRSCPIDYCDYCPCIHPKI
jgi:hypothetical protein